VSTGLKKVSMIIGSRTKKGQSLPSGVSADVSPMALSADSMRRCTLRWS
jgi:hypothetical protein